MSTVLGWCSYLFLEYFMGLPDDARRAWRRYEMRKKFPGVDDTKQVIYQGRRLL